MARAAGSVASPKSYEARTILSRFGGPKRTDIQRSDKNQRSYARVSLQPSDMPGQQTSLGSAQPTDERGGRRPQGAQFVRLALQRRERSRDHEAFHVFRIDIAVVTAMESR